MSASQGLATEKLHILDASKPTQKIASDEKTPLRDLLSTLPPHDGISLPVQL